MVSALVSRLSGLGSSSGWGRRYVQYSDKFSYSIVLYFIVLPHSQIYC